MKHEVTLIPALKVTAYEFDPIKNKVVPSSKICHKATVAAEHYALTRNAHWWRTREQFPLGLYPTWHARYAKLERRALKVFKKYLP